MKIRRKEYIQASDGWHTGIVASVADLPDQKTAFGVKDQLKITFLVDEKTPDGKPIEVNALVTASLHKDARLVEILKALGVDPGVELDTSLLVNRTCRIQTLRHVSTNGRSFANIAATAPLRKSDKPPRIPLDWKPRPPKTNGKPAAVPAPVMPEEEGEGEELPFEV